MGSLEPQTAGRGVGGRDTKYLKGPRRGSERWPARWGGSRRWIEGIKTTLA